MMLTRDRKIRLLWAAIAAILIAGSACLYWRCERDPRINFLAAHGKAEWIVYPVPTDGAGRYDVETSAVFRRKFALPQPSSKAVLSLRAFKKFEVKVNDKLATNVLVSPSNWKDATELDISRLLHPGTNELSITVVNRKAQPALWASLELITGTLNSDREWEASLLGAAWRPAWPAGPPVPLASGDSLYYNENTLRALREKWPDLLMFAFIGCVLVFGGSALVRQYVREKRAVFPVQKILWVVVGGLALLWAALFINNLRLLPRYYGFDEPSHEEYINFICKNKSLPLANQGWEMCQPPLYYIASAAITWVSGDNVVTDDAAIMLRVFGLLTAITHFVLIFLCLRLVFPDRPGAQWFGLMLAACVPEHLLIAHFVTNESLSAALVTATLYGCLLLLKAQNESHRLAVGIGVCFGAALLTKLTALLAIPFIGGILIYRTWNKPVGVRGPAYRTLAIVSATAFAVCGWHYIRVWRHFGTPFVENWDSASGLSWWLDAGFQTSSYFTHFGQSLVRPYDGAFNSFWDGIYSSMWGDGFFSSAGSWDGRPAWNYPFMTVGFLLAIIPAVIILAGLVVCVVRFLCKPKAVWFLLLGLALAAYAALFYMSFKLPYYYSVKAFYVLCTLLPMCALGAAGWEWLTARFPKIRPALCVMVLVWAMNVYASFWINGGSAATHAMKGGSYLRQGRAEKAAAEWKEALRLDPRNVYAGKCLVALDSDQGDFNAAMEVAKPFLTQNPQNGEVLETVAKLLGRSGHLNEAIQLAKQATNAAPDYVGGYELLSQLADQAGDDQACVDALREALRIKPYSPAEHLKLFFALQKVGDKHDAEEQFETAGSLFPKWPDAEAHDQFGDLLAGQKRWDLAARQFAEASRLAPSQNLYLNHLALVEGEAGRFAEAIASATKAMELSQSQGNMQAVAINAELIDHLRQQSGQSNTAPTR